ncbi:MAG TPA: ParB/RepB/Spo0J family partition protein [Candidatus Hydrogenedentes bacterium]|nr:ParB/RepB/Spo0J family partition protein [Candidatus Hydrogenedentota bacterium]HPG66330.1 ParB/RepB/Spo0J family partition protein [Candidatus Hydrogenedentota bacterium]
MVSGKKKSLGRGLDALLSSDVNMVDADPMAGATPSAVAPVGDRVLQLDPHEIRPNPRQPRRAFHEESLQELAESIRRDGVQEPVIVRKVDDRYELVSGERRVRAAIMAEKATVPAVCREVSDQDMLKLGLIENIQREDLNPIELAEGYRALQEEFDWTQEHLSAEIGKNRVTVANTLRLLNLPADVRQLVADGALSMGHAKAILALDSPAAQREAARKVVAKGLSVRQAEQLAQSKPPTGSRPQAKDPNVALVEDELRGRLGTRVTLRAKASGRGRIEIEYFSLDELERILDLLRS